MKRIKIIAPLLILMMFISISDTDAQRRKRKSRRHKVEKNDRKTERADLDGTFKDHLWYGANVNLQLNNSYFVFGLNPMVGYKFNNWLSAGPTIILDYTQWKQNLNGNYKSIRVMNYGVGAFVRATFLNQFFVQGEATLINDGTARIDPYNPDDYLISREAKTNYYLGLGYYSGSNGGWGYQATLLYNLVNDPNNPNIPISYKIGFVYNL